ncbi:MAG: ubiquinol-cytochrome c reductase iron-sulfur subunit [Hyphomicrobiales bacterium]|nr:ubiquinol-cytochrome c reductase iron-sulfur subunit [Hyphomicrobiales bacterium]
MTVTETEEPTRRDFLYIATGAMGAVAVGGIVWPLVDQMNPDAGTLALASIEVDISGVAVGQAITVMWRGKPVFIRNRTDEEVEAANAVPLDQLRDPQTDAERTKPGHENLLVQVGICTHLGCVPLPEAGDYDGWFCPCHGSHYDTSGRIRRGPAPTNLEIPPYEFLDETRIVIG